MLIRSTRLPKSSHLTSRGGTLWMTAGHPQEELDAAWTFLKWMSEPAQQVTWHKGTGYFAIRKSAIDLLEKEGWFETYPNYKVAFPIRKSVNP